MTIEILKQKITAIETDMKKIEASFNQLAGAKLMLEGLIADMNAPVVVPDTSPVKQQEDVAAPAGTDAV